MTRFIDKVAVVVGGSSGIGLASAMAFAQEGASVVITGRDPEVLAAAAQEVGRGCVAVRADVTRMIDIEAIFQEVKERFQKIDALFLNAGIGAFLPLEDVTEADWDRVTSTNLKGLYFSAQKAVPLMLKGSSIVLCGSAGHAKALAGNSIYASTKAGLRSLARNLGLELLGRGIRVNCLSPGPVETPIIRKSSGGDPAIEEAIRVRMAAAVPMQRLGHPSEIARAVLFLASDDASFITGIDLPVDGGLTSF